MRIGYFGGSFDPPHRGHLAVARAARDRFSLNRVLLAPTARQPFKPQGPLASFADRLRLTQLLCIGEPGLEASAIDGPQPGDAPNYTVDTLRRLRAQLTLPVSLGRHPRRGSAFPASAPDAAPEPPPQLLAILGTDAFAHFPHWREPEELLRLAEWIIVSRPGVPLSSPTALILTPAERSRIHPLDGVAVPVSATELRARLGAHEDCSAQIPGPVLAYLLRKHLYAS